MARAVYQVLADWGDDGYANAGADVTARVLPDRGLSCARGKDQIRALAPPIAGRFDATLDNRSKAYSPENGASPLAGKLVPGHRVRWRALPDATYGAATYGTATYGLTADLFTGTLDDLPQHPELGYRAVDIPALGSLARLKGVRVSTALYRDIRTDQALGYLLDVAGWPAADRVLTAGRTVLTFWWCAESDAFEMAVSLLNAEGPGASLYEDGRGRIVFEDRHYRLLTARCTTSQATIRDSGAEPLHTAPFAYNPGLKDVVGSAVVAINARTHVDSAVVWQLGTTLSLAPNESRAFRIASSDPLAGAVAPVAGTDYNLAAGGLAAATLDRTSGAILTLTVTAGASGATLLGLQLRAEKYTAQAAQVKNSVAGSSIPGAGGYTLSPWPEIHPNQAQDLADLIVTAYRDPRPTVRLTLEGASATMLANLLSREVSDRITVVEAQTGLNADCFVEQVAHDVSLAGGRHRATLGCEKVSTATYPNNPIVVDGTAGQGIDSAATIIY